jgi:hypothetical protein
MVIFVVGEERSAHDLLIVGLGNGLGMSAMRHGVSISPLSGGQPYSESVIYIFTGCVGVLAIIVGLILGFAGAEGDRQEPS